MKDYQKPLAFRIRSLNNEIKRLFERTALAENDANLTGMQYALLGFVCRNSSKGPVYQKDLESEFNIRRSTASEMLKLLEKQGYICRINDADDTRLKQIVLTEKALELHKIAMDNMERVQQRLQRGISDEEMEQLFRTLDKIKRNAQGDLDDEEEIDIKKGDIYDQKTCKMH